MNEYDENIIKYKILPKLSTALSLISIICIIYLMNFKYDNNNSIINNSNLKTTNN